MHAMLQCPRIVARYVDGCGFAEREGPAGARSIGAGGDGEPDAVSRASLDGDGSGWDAYLRYSALTVPMIKARGGTLLWTGEPRRSRSAGSRQQWDYLALVYYPTVAAFIDMMTSQDYEQRCDPHRTNGCAEHVIIATREAYSKFKLP